MRGLAIVMALFLIPAALAQTTVLEESDGDATAQGPGGVALPYETETFDVYKLDVTETSQDFTFDVYVKSLQKSWNPEDSARFFVDFAHMDQGYRLAIWRQVAGNTPAYFGWLMGLDPGRQTYYQIERLELQVDAPQGTISTTLARDSLVDGNGTAPTAGRQFTEFRVTVDECGGWAGCSTSTAVAIRDNMPDQGYGPTPYEIQFGLTQSGKAALSCDLPVRASNGEEATFLFYVEGRSDFDDDRRFTLATQGIPDGWEVTLPAQTIGIKANSKVNFPVLVSTPFVHVHGDYKSLVLTMTAEDTTAHVGRVELGIRYLEIPQPAGHHNQLTIHTRSVPGQMQVAGLGLGGGNAVAYMNTLEDDDFDEDLPAPPTQPQGGVTDSRFIWRVYLEPKLQLGLDFDTAAEGTISARFSSTLPAPGAVMSGAYYHEVVQEFFNGVPRSVERTKLADIPPTVAASVNGPTELSSTIVPLPESDYLEYDPMATLYLELVLEIERPDTFFISHPDTQPVLLDGTMELPLLEYRDPVNDVFNGLSGLRLRYEDVREKWVNPAETVIFNLTVENSGAVDDLFAIKVNGTNAEWARALGDQTIFVPTGESRLLVIAVSPPDAAVHGDVIDLRISVASESTPTTQGIIQVVATVDEDRDHTDESFLIADLEKSLTSAKKKAPGLPIVFALVGLALLARSVRVK